MSQQFKNLKAERKFLLEWWWKGLHWSYMQLSLSKDLHYPLWNTKQGQLF